MYPVRLNYFLAPIMHRPLTNILSPLGQYDVFKLFKSTPVYLNTYDLCSWHKGKLALKMAHARREGVETLECMCHFYYSPEHRVYGRRFLRSESNLTLISRNM